MIQKNGGINFCFSEFLTIDHFSNFRNRKNLIGGFPVFGEIGKRRIHESKKSLEYTHGKASTNRVHPVSVHTAIQKNVIRVLRVQPDAG